MVRKCKSCQGFIKGYQRSYGIGKCGNTPLENQITWNNEDCMAEACKKPRNISTWVMCDKCERWFHLVCVGIIYSKEELEHMEWKCSDCGERKEEGAEEHHSPEVLKQHREERINPLLRFNQRNCASSPSIFAGRGSTSSTHKPPQLFQVNISPISSPERDSESSLSSAHNSHNDSVEAFFAESSLSSAHNSLLLQD